MAEGQPLSLWVRAGRGRSHGHRRQVAGARNWSGQKRAGRPDPRGEQQPSTGPVRRQRPDGLLSPLPDPCEQGPGNAHTRWFL